QVRRQERERLRIRNDHPLDVLQVRRVPPADEPEQDRHVAVERRLPEVRVDARGAGEELLEAFETELERDRESGGRPKAIAAADPIPPRKYVGRGNSER